MPFNDTIKGLKTIVLAAQTAVIQAQNDAQNKKNNINTVLNASKTNALAAMTNTESAKAALRAAQKTSTSINDAANFKIALADITDMTNAASNAMSIMKATYASAGVADPYPNYQINSKGHYALIPDARADKENTPDVNMGSILLWDDNTLAKLQLLRKNGSNINWNNSLGRTIICTQDIDTSLIALDLISSFGHLQNDDDMTGFYD